MKIHYSFLIELILDIMMIGMLAMAKGHIINKQPDKIRKIKTI